MAQGPVQHGAPGPGTCPNSTPPVPGSFVLGKSCNLLTQISELSVKWNCRATNPQLQPFSSAKGNLNQQTLAN